MREGEYLRGRYRAILSDTGLILLLSGALMLSPLVAAFVYPDEAKNMGAFGVPALALILSGLLLWRLFRPTAPIALTTQEGGVIVLLSWVTVSILSAWPFMAVLKMDFTRAVFEAVSGWTTTGLSVVDVSVCGQMILLWRSTMQLAGGAGLAIIMMSAIAGPTGAGLSSAEGRGDQLVPQVRHSARLVLTIYGGYALAGILAYRLAGMSLFDAVSHAFAAVSTGGFSTRPESIGYWNSVTIEAVTLPLMLLGNLSFVTAWFLWRGKCRVVFLNGEVRLLTVASALSIAALFIFTARGLYPQLGKSMRVAVFEAVTALTTTGFSTVGYGNWNSSGILVLIILMLIGGGTCSTAGGIKQFRIYILCKFLIWELTQPFLPRTAVVQRSVWEGNQRVFVADARLRSLSIFIFFYVSSFAAGVLMLCAYGYPLRESLFEFASAIGTVGLSVGVTSATAPDPVLWAEIIAMFLGRLEFMIVIVSFIKLGKDVRRMLP